MRRRDGRLTVGTVPRAAGISSALVFVVFDVELVFLFPWALAYNQLGLFALFEMVVFIFLLVVALVYTWRKGALEWA